VKVVALLVTVATLAAGWYWLAPEQLGGRTSYAVTFGVSMEPHFHQGDLVVLRRQSSYRVGEVVAYHSHDLNRNVLHRIIAIRDGRYTFKGDNNSFVDPERPTAADLVGAEWLHFPTVGTWLASLHSPWWASITAFAIVLLLVLGGGGTARRRWRRRSLPRPVPVRQKPAAGAAVPPSAGLVVAAAGAGALVAAAALGGIAFTRPLERTLVWANLYVQHGRFSYSAKVGEGATYQSSSVRSGEPVYLELVHRLPVAFSYRLQAADPSGLGGTVRLDAVLHDDEGWRHTLALAPARPFRGAGTTVRGVLDLQRLQHVIAAFERETGVHNTLYHLSLQAHVAVHGTVSARPLATSFSPRLALNMDAYRLVVVQPTDPGAPANSLAQSQGGAGTRVETAYLHALGLGFTVAEARRLAKLLGLAGLVLGGLGAALMLVARRDHEAASIRRKYEDWIIDVLPDPARAVGERRVPSMDALARLAQRYERLILHERRDEGDAFLVEDDGVVYAYVVRDWSRPHAVVTS
jgi:signal peptidase I